MKSRILQVTCILLAVGVLISCGPSGMIWPSDRIGPMWVNRYGHTNAEMIWEHCSDTMPETPGTRTTECTIPWVDELFIGHGIRALSESQRDALWEARTWELYIDGHAVDLPAFNVADFDMEQTGTTYEIRLWRIRLRKIPPGEHTLRYVMHVSQEIEDDPDAKPVGTYELVVNFTFEEK